MIISWCPGGGCDPCQPTGTYTVPVPYGYSTGWNIDLAGDIWQRNVQTGEVYGPAPPTIDPNVKNNFIGAGSFDNLPVDVNGVQVGTMQGSHATVYPGNSPDFPNFQNANGGQWNIQLSVVVITSPDQTREYQIETLQTHTYYHAIFSTPIGTTVLEIPVGQPVPEKTDPMVAAGGPTFPITQ